MVQINKVAIWILVLIFPLGCAGTLPTPTADTTAPPSPSDPAKPNPGETTVTQQSPRALAAVSLLQQAQMLIDAQRLDDAIGLLERVLNLHQKNGAAYYHLAQAWLLKGNGTQAAAFHRLSRRYLESDHSWAKRLDRQRRLIGKLKDTEEEL